MTQFLLGAVLTALALTWWAVPACMVGIRHHSPERTPLGGFRCRKCGKPGDTLDDFGEHGFVNPVRKTFSRADGGTVTRQTDFEADVVPLRRVH